MNNKIIIQLLKNNIHEIQTLINHFESEQDDLQAGFSLLESRLKSLNNDIDILKLNINNEANIKQEKAVNTSIIKELHSEARSNNVKINAKKTSTSLIHKTNNEYKTVESPKTNKTISIEHSKTDSTNNKINTETPTNISTLNDKLQSSLGNDSHIKIPSSKLIDRESARGINDQFLFIRELFDNNSEAYNSAIAYINSQNEYDKIITHLKQSHKWDDDNVITIQFFELIKRKFE